MAPTGKTTKGEALWREAWVGCPHIGVVDVGKDGSGQEQLVIKCKSVFREHGAEAEVVDDGRTVGVGLGDTVSFGIVLRKGKAPIAVNIYRTPATKKKKRRAAVEAEEAEDDDDELPPDLVGELPGVVRNTSSKTGDFFIECPKVFDAYSRDPKIFKADMPDGIVIGDSIYFQVKPPSHELSAPIAKNIRKAPASVGKEVMALARDRGKGKGFGKGGGKGRAPIRRSGGATMRMNGIVKRPSETTGRYFIFCQDISDVYNKDAQIPDEEVPAGGLNVGDRISFDVDEPDESKTNETPWAFNIKVVGGTTGKKKELPDMGDAEDEGDGEIEEKDDGEAEDAEELEEPQVDKDEDAGADDLDAEEEPVAPKPAKKPRKAKVVEKAVEEEEEDQIEPQEPETPEGWAAAQDRLFPGLPKLPKGWIRIRSKTRGLVYFYNVDTGTSTPHEPKM